MFLCLRSVRLFLCAPLVLTLIGLTYAGEPQNEHAAIKPVSRMDAKGWKSRHESFLARAKQGEVDVLFLGDSITQGWEGNGKKVWAGKYAPMKAANFGIGGDRTQHVLWRITEGKELEGIMPKVVVLMIGTNNMGANREGQIDPKRGDTADQIAEGVEAIVKELHKQFPRAKVLLLAIFPRAEKPDTEARAKIKQTNERLARFAKQQNNVRFLDIGAKFLTPDGVLTKEIMPDFLHLTPKGYEIWAEAIQKDLTDMLK